MQPLAFEQISVDEILSDVLDEKKLNVSVLRLDKIHPVISGNKWFKLKYHLEAFKNGNYKGIATVGGAYSNHIIATACIGAMHGIKTAGNIRGEKPEKPGHTLLDAARYGMEIQYVSRIAFKRKDHDEFIQEILKEYPDYYFIPEGGAGSLGQKGCQEILSLLPKNNYTHIVCAIGTGTMFLGLANSSDLCQQVIGIPVLKLANILDQEKNWIHPPAKLSYCRVVGDYHFGGYAKRTDELIKFMNDFYSVSGIPTDFVYTGKLFFGVFDLIKKDFFKEGSSVLVIHSGGLQGNLSLPKDLLIF